MTIDRAGAGRPPRPAPVNPVEVAAQAAEHPRPHGFRIQFRERVICGEIDLTRHRNDWTSLPPFVGPMAVADAGTGRDTAVAAEAAPPNGQRAPGSATGEGAGSPPQT